MPDRFPYPSLDRIDHRPWPLPGRRWIMRQVWNDLLFLHWEVDAGFLRSSLPEGLEPDLHDGKAWLGIVPFDMRGVTGRGCPAPPAFCDFPEINVRTYVLKDGKPGVWFYSLDVPSGLAVWAARTFFHLPYFKAEVRVERDGDWIRYRHRREALRFEADYRPLKIAEAAPDSFEHWATARYCLYTADRRGRVIRGDIHHAPWPLRHAEADLLHNTLLEGFPIGGMYPSALFSERLEVVVYPLQRA